MFTRPALVVAVCLAAGLALWRVAPCTPALALAVFAVFVIVTLVVWRRVPAYLLPSFAPTVIAAGVCLGAVALRIDATVDQTLRMFEDGREHLVYATVDDDPSPRIDGLSFRAVLHAVRDSSGTHALDAVRARVFCAARGGDSLVAARRGDRLALFGKLRAPKGIRNPGDMDYASYLRVQGVLVDMSVRSSTFVERIGSDPPNAIIATIEDLRRTIGDALDRYVGGEEGELLKGLLIGERGELSEETREAFVATGTFHVLAVSGLHVAYVALILFGVLSPILNRYVHSSLLIAALLAYSVLAGGAPSIMRAVMMAVLATTGMLLERRIDALNIIGGAACVLLIIDPAQLFAAGFQLSFAAALGLAAFQPKLRVVLVRGRVARIRPLRWAAELACASIAAQCATLPLTAIYFERLSPAGIIANLLVVPASGIALGLAVLVSISTPVPWLAILFGDMARAYVHGFLRATEHLARLPFASVAVPPFTIIECIVFYVVAVFVMRATTGMVLVRRVTIALIFWCAIVISPLRPHPVLEPGALAVAAVDVGQGDGIVVQFPNGKILVVDTGPDRPSHLAALPVSAFLLRQGIRHVDALVLTHLHADHIGGACDLLRRVAVDTIYHSGERAGDSLARALQTLAARLQIATRVAHDGDMLSLDSSVRVYVLHPDSTVVAHDGWTADGNFNNGSVVLKVQYGSTAILLSGDLERDREAALVARYGEFLRAEILKTGHHGSKTSTTPGYLEAVRPGIAIVSVGENKFGHPSPPVIARLREAGIEIDRTDEQGAVVWWSDGRVWTRREWR